MIACLAIISFNASAQTYAPCTPDPSFTEAGLYPTPDELPCLVVDSSANITIQFKNFADVSGITVDSLRVDSITNMPCGAEYYISETDKTFGSGETGCIQVCGTVSDAPGQYRLGLYVTLWASIAPNGISGEAGALAQQFNAGDFSYFVRVKALEGDACPAVDTSSSATNVTAACATVDKTGQTDYCEAINSVNEIANISSFGLYPNPTATELNVVFTAENADVYNMHVVNVFGQQVINRQLNVNAGLNVEQIDVTSLPSGVYLDRKSVV